MSTRAAPTSTTLHEASRRAWWRPSRFGMAVVAAYALARLASGILMSIVAGRQVPTGWTGDPVTYLTFTTQWDAQWYLLITESGYPRELPLTEAGDVAQNAWAFHPLFPFTTKVLMQVTGGSFTVVASTWALILGFGAALLMAHLLRERVGPMVALAAVTVWACQPAAPVLQVAYTESMAMLLLLSVIWALTREHWLLAGVLGIVTALSRPIALPLAVVFAVALVMRWRARAQRPLERAEVLSAVGGLVLTGISGVLWPVVAAVVTGNPAAYTETQSAWRAVGEVQPFVPWRDISTYLWGSNGLFFVACGFGFVWALMAGPWARALGPVLRAWAVAYPAYLLMVLDPSTSIFRYFIPLFPGAVVLVGGGWVTHRPSRAVVIVRAAVLVGAGVAGQWIWLDWLWRFIPPSDYPP